MTGRSDDNSTGRTQSSRVVSCSVIRHHSPPSAANHNAALIFISAANHKIALIYICIHSQRSSHIHLHPITMNLSYFQYVPMNKFSRIVLKPMGGLVSLFRPSNVY